MRKYTSDDLYLAISSGDSAKARGIIDGNKSLLAEPPDEFNTWVGEAARSGSLTILNALVSHGCDVNTQAQSPDKTTPLEVAIREDKTEIAEKLLQLGANPNAGRPLIAAINRDESVIAMKFVKLLVEHGADVNRFYDLYGNPDDQFTALDWADDPDIAAYLREHGAKTGAELDVGSARGAASEPQGTRMASTIEFFSQQLGQVDERALREIIPGDPSITIHVVPANDRDHITLFTTGMSERAMSVPEGREQYRFAELMIDLPKDWPLSKDDPLHGWPFEWLRRIARYPHENNTWLGWPITIVSNDEPDLPLAPNTKQTAIMLLAKDVIPTHDGEVIQVYKLFPIYKEERDLEMREGLPALMNALDRVGISEVVDVQRPNAALGN